MGQGDGADWQVVSLLNEKRQVQNELSLVLSLPRDHIVRKIQAKSRALITVPLRVPLRLAR